MNMSKNLIKACEAEEERIHLALSKLLSMLFWKDYSESYLTLEEKQQFIQLIDTYTFKGSDDEGYYGFKNESNVTEFINSIRAKTNLEKLP